MDTRVLHPLYRAQGKEQNLVFVVFHYSGQLAHKFHALTRGQLTSKYRQLEMIAVPPA